MEYDIREVEITNISAFNPKGIDSITKMSHYGISFHDETFFC